jgi:CBS domain containing-hemolysin-like protein
MGDEDLESLPRDFYEAIVEIRDNLDDFGVPESVIEETLDTIELLIIEALGRVKEKGEGGNDENGKEQVE